MTDTGQFTIAKSFAQLARQIGSHPDIETTRSHIMQVARSSSQCSGVSIWHRKSQNAMTFDSSNGAAFLPTLEGPLTEEPDGPSWHAIRTKTPVASPDLTTERVWRDYAQRVVTETPVRSVVAYPLEAGELNLLVLTLYSEHAGHFTDELVQIGSVFASHATTALHKAYLTERATNLEIALASNRRIGMAVGVLMSENRITDETAFDWMRVTSQTMHIKLRDVAEDVIATGTLPTLRSA